MDYINSLISGIVIFNIGKEYIYVKPASAEDKTFAEFFSKEQYDEAILDGIWTAADTLEYLIHNGYWSEEQEKQLTDLDEIIENMKVDYFNNFYNSQSKEYIKINLDKQTEKQMDLIQSKNIFYDKTCEYIKSYAFASHIINNNAFLFSNKKRARLYYSSSILVKHYSNMTNSISRHVRPIVKSHEWRQKWSILQSKIFENRNSSLSDLQLSAMSWSSYYDSIYKSYDGPSSDIIEDDIALDGWSIKERRKRDEEAKQQNAEKLLPKNMQNAGEVFIPARNQKEIQDINSLNSGYAKAKVKALRQDLNQHGNVREEDLSSTKRELQMKALEEQKNRRRK